MIDTVDTFDTFDTVINIAVIAHDGLWEHTPLTLFTLLTLLKPHTLLAFTLCINALFYYDYLGHQVLKKITHDRRGDFLEFYGTDGTDHTP